VTSHSLSQDWSSSHLLIENELWMMIRMTPNTPPQNVHFSLTAVHTAQLVSVLSIKEYCVGSVTRKKTKKVRSYIHVQYTCIFPYYGRTPLHSLAQSCRNHNSVVLVWNANPVGCEIAKNNVWTDSEREGSYCCGYMPRCVWSDLYVRSSNSLSHSPHQIHSVTSWDAPIPKKLFPMKKFQATLNYSCTKLVLGLPMRKMERGALGFKQL